MTLQSPDHHAVQLLRTVNILREKSPMLCDIFIECEGVRIPAHKVVIVAYSRVLAATVLSNKDQMVITLDHLELSCKVLQQMVQFMYTNNMGSYQNVHDIYRAAKLLDIPFAVHYIEDYLTDSDLNYDIPSKNSESRSSGCEKVINEIFNVSDSTTTDQEDCSNRTLECNVKEESCRVPEVSNNADDIDTDPLETLETSDVAKEPTAQISSTDLAASPQNDIAETIQSSLSSEMISQSEQSQALGNYETLQAVIDIPAVHSVTNVSAKSDSKQLYAQYRGEDGTYTCPHCSFSSALYKAFFSHVSKHKIERPYQCETCAKAFKELKHLKAHMRTHSSK